MTPLPHYSPPLVINVKFFGFFYNIYMKIVRDEKVAMLRVGTMAS